MKITGYSINVPTELIDAFLVMINVIFEKTYVTSEEYEILWPNMKKILEDNIVYQQANKFGWDSTLEKFTNWKKKRDKITDFPVFLPFSLIIYSYFEKLTKKRTFHPTSFLYYFFFRIRYLLNKTLPYD